MPDEFEIVLKMFGAAVIVIIAFAFVDFLISPHIGSIAGYSINMPGIAWVGVPAFIVLILILYAKNRM